MDLIRKLFSTTLLLSCIAVPSFAGDVAQIVNFTGGRSTFASPAPTVGFTTMAGDSIIVGLHLAEHHIGTRAIDSHR